MALAGLRAAEPRLRGSGGRPDSADIHNISQGIYDPQRVIDSGGDLYAGNVPYVMQGHPAADRLSFYYDSKCDLSIPDVPEDRAVSLDIRHEGCTPLPEPGAAASLLAGALSVALLAKRAAEQSQERRARE